MVEIRSAREEDAEAVISMYPRLGYKRDLWRWQYEKPPAGSAIRASYVACEDGKVIGFNGAMPAVAVSEGKETLVHWSVDFIVLPEFRGRGVGNAIKTRMEAERPLLLAFGSSAITQHMHRKRGWTPPGQVGEFYYQARFSNPRGLAKKALQVLYRRPVPTLGCVGHTLPMAEVIDEVDALWHRSAEGYQYAICRNEPYVRWKYVNHPLATYTGIRITDASGLLRALGVARISRGTSRLVDYIGPRWDAAAKSAIVKELLLRATQATQVHCITTDVEFKGILGSYGFRTYSPASFFGFRGPGVSLESEDWFLMTGDSDGDFLDAAADRA